MPTASALASISLLCPYIHLSTFYIVNNSHSHFPMASLEFGIFFTNKWSCVCTELGQPKRFMNIKGVDGGGDVIDWALHNDFYELNQHVDWDGGWLSPLSIIGLRSWVTIVVLRFYWYTYLVFMSWNQPG